MQKDDRKAQELLTAIDRRTLLKASVSGAAALGIATFLPACRTSDTAGERFSALRFFQPGEALVLEAFAARLLPVHASRPTVAEVELVARLDEKIDWLQATVEPGLGQDLRNLVRLVEYGPFFIGYHFGRFTRLDAASQDAYLRSWERSRFAPLRMAFRNLRALCVFFYFSDQRTWPSTHYAGPWLTGGKERLQAWAETGA